MQVQKAPGLLPSKTVGLCVHSKSCHQLIDSVLSTLPFLLSLNLADISLLTLLILLLFLWLTLPECCCNIWILLYPLLSL